MPEQQQIRYRIMKIPTCGGGKRTLTTTDGDPPPLMAPVQYGRHGYWGIFRVGGHT
jgi:hypothetical protein